MHRWNPRTRLLRGGLIAIVLSISGVLVAYASLPSAAANGQGHAALGAANGQADSHSQADLHPTENTNDGPSTALDNLAANHDRLIAHLNDVLTRLSGKDHVPAAATDAIQHVIDMLGGDIGLNRAIEAVGGNTSAPDHPTKP
jgi:hypothetical protein